MVVSMPGFAIQLKQETPQHLSGDTISRLQATSASLLLKKDFSEATLVTDLLCGGCGKGGSWFCVLKELLNAE